MVTAGEEMDPWKRKKIYRCLAVQAILLLGFFSTMDCYYDIADADFLFYGQKFENVDFDGFVGDKNVIPLFSPDLPVIPEPVASPPFDILLPYLPQYCATAAILRC